MLAAEDAVIAAAAAVAAVVAVVAAAVAATAAAVAADKLIHCFFGARFKVGGCRTSMFFPPGNPKKCGGIGKPKKLCNIRKEGLTSMTTVTVSLSSTTFVSSENPNSNYSVYPLLYAGMDPSFGTCIGYLNVPLPDLSISSVDSAKLQFSVIVKNGDEPSPISVLRATQPFSTSSVTYQTQPTTAPTASAVDVTTANLYQTIEIDITELVNQWISGTYPNYGIALVNTDGSTLVQLATSAISYQPYFPQFSITYSGSPVRPATASDFCMAQLAHVLQQFIALYPSTSLSIYTGNVNPVAGTPHSLTLSPDGTYAGLLILENDGNQILVPLDAITAIHTGAGTVYNPDLSFLTVPTLAEGADKYIVDGIYDSLSLSESVLINMQGNLSETGLVYKNPYGMIVISDAEGNSPIFIPVTGSIAQILPNYQKAGDAPLPQITSESQETPTATD